MRQHSNAFDLIRLFAAGLVLWSHQHALMGLPEPSVAVLRTSFGGLGVFIFFAVSGYLNTLSVLRNRSTQMFLLNRALRIYPALVVCVAFTVIVGFFVASDMRAFVSPKLLSYVVKDMTLFFGEKAGVPGVFETNAFPEALNGSLWTLPYEVKMYVVLAVCFAASRYNPVVPILVFAGAAAIAVLAAIGLLSPLPLNEYWLQFSILFLAGSAVAAAQILAGLPIAIGALVTIVLLFAGLGEPLLAGKLLLVAIVISIGCSSLPPWFRLPLDISYSVYLYAFPVQQLSAMLIAHFWPALLFSSAITLALAVLSALLIERPALRLKSEVQLSGRPANEAVKA